MFFKNAIEMRNWNISNLTSWNEISKWDYFFSLRNWEIEMRIFFLSSEVRFWNENIFSHLRSENFKKYSHFAIFEVRFFKSHLAARSLAHPCVRSLWKIWTDNSSSESVPNNSKNWEWTRNYDQMPQSGLKCKVLNDESWLFLKWTVARKWTVLNKIGLYFGQSWRSWTKAFGIWS